MSCWYAYNPFADNKMKHLKGNRLVVVCVEVKWEGSFVFWHVSTLLPEICMSYNTLCRGAAGSWISIQKERFYMYVHIYVLYALL